MSRTSSQSTISTGPMSVDATSRTRFINGQSRRSTPSAESNFFGALKQKICSSSRSWSRSSKDSTQTNTILPPTSMPRDSSQSHTQPRVQRTSSTLSCRSGASSTCTASKRHSTTSSFYSGRHSNEWLFGGFSVSDTVKDAYHYLREKRE